MPENIQPISNLNNPNMKMDDPPGMPFGFGMPGMSGMPGGFQGHHIFHHHFHHHFFHHGFQHRSPYEY